MHSDLKREAERPPAPNLAKQQKLLPRVYDPVMCPLAFATPVSDFKELGCWTACHTGLNPSSNNGGKASLKYTNHAGEILDMWH